MKLLDRLVLKDLLTMFGVGIGMFSSLYFCGGPLLEASKYISQGQSVWAVLKLLINSIPIILSITFPMATLLSVLIGFGRLAGDNEAVALFAGGVSFPRVAAPAIALGVVASILGFLLNNYGATQANTTINNLKSQVFKELAQTSKPIDHQLSADGYTKATFHIEKGLDAKTGMLKDITITTFDKSGYPQSLLHAGYAKWMHDPGFLLWQFDDVNIYLFGKDGAGMTHTYEQTLNSRELPKDVANLKISEDMAKLLQRDDITLSFGELSQKTAGLLRGESPDIEKARQSEHQMWSLVALPLASLVFAMIGAPLGLRPQRSTKNNTGWWLAILIIFAYYVLYTVMKSMAYGGTVPPVIAAFLPDIVGVIAGVYLCAKATT